MKDLNHSEMNTVVQTYLVEETVELIYDNEKLDKWNKLVSDLGLTGQTKLAQPEKSPIPFMYAKKGVVNIVSTLCPVCVNVEEYNITPIPVEILDLIALSKRERYFGQIQICYDDKKPDPFCVGVVQSWGILKKDGCDDLIRDRFSSQTEAEAYNVENNLNGRTYHYSWEDKRYLIGRWGDVKMSMEELKAIAKKRYSENQMNDYNKEMQKIKRAIEDLEISTNEYFA